MSLARVTIPKTSSGPSADVAELIRIAELRTASLMKRRRWATTGFVPSNASILFHTLRGLSDGELANGNSFCEWGSGSGTVTCMAAKLGWDAHGIEIEPELVDESIRLASHFSLAATFVQGNFVPSKRRQIAQQAFEDNLGRYPWLNNQAEDAYQKLGRSIASFDVVFAYPWPGEMPYIEQLFIAEAADGALLVTFDDTSSVNVWQRVTNRPNATTEAHASPIVPIG